MSTAWFGRFLRSQFYNTPPKPTKSFEGQTVIVTGSSAGLGLAAARQITQLNAAKVILAVRNVSKGEGVKRSMEAATGRTGVIEVWALDLSSYQNVKDFAARASRELDRIDVLLENAGTRAFKYSTLEGDESTVTTNVLSTFLLAVLMLPKLKETARKYNTQPRITFVGSDLHFLAKFPEKDASNTFDALNDENANINTRYGITKLIDILLVRHLASQLEARSHSSVIVNTLSPSLCFTDAFKNGEMMGPITRSLVVPPVKMIARSADVGARTLVIAASAGSETQGGYMEDGKMSKPSAFVRSEDGRRTGEKTWGEFLVRTEKVAPGLSNNV